MLVDMKEMLQRARSEGYAVPAFNVTDLYSVMVVAEVCSEEQAPCLLEVAEVTLGHVAPAYMVAVARAAAEQVPVPVALHLDHGRSFDMAMRAVRAGFTSVMIDQSDQPYETNVAVTRKVVEASHAAGVSVEAELGHVGVASEGASAAREFLTDPAQAEEFVRETGVDALAVAIGTAHGAYHFEPELDLERLEAISRRVAVPLVVHGGSGTPNLERAARLGVAKVNVFTDLQVPIREKVKQIVDSEPLDRLNAVRIWLPANRKAAGVVRQYLHKLGAAGRVKSRR